MSPNQNQPPEFFVNLVRTGLAQFRQGSSTVFDDLLSVRKLRYSEDAQLVGLVRYSITQAIDRLGHQDAAAARILRYRFVEGKAIQQIVSILHRSPASVHRDLRAAIEKLTEIMWRDEVAAQENFEKRQLRRLEPPTYDQLFGVDDMIESLLNLFQSPDCPSLIMLAGEGGIGKTSLADYLCRKLIESHSFAGFGWVSIRPTVSLWDVRPFFSAESSDLAIDKLFEELVRQLLGEKYVPSPFDLQKALDRLQVFLQQSRYFIVLDNLETLGQGESLLSIIRRFEPYTQFLLTSRKSLATQPGVYQFNVPPLTAGASIALMRYEANKRNAVSLMNASDDDLMAVYEKVGGNPLALRLVVGQSLLFSLPTILDDITLARGKSVGQLYEYLFRWAWNNLDESEQLVLLAMPLLPPEGGSFEQIVAVTGLDSSIVHDALAKLISQSLVEHRLDMQQSHYAVHGLTRVFVQEQAAQWR